MLREVAMTMHNNYHIRPHPDGWAVSREGAFGTGSVHSTKSEALAAGRECAKRDKVDLVVHRKNERATQ
jgi:hypothetical protein